MYLRLTSLERGTERKWDGEGGGKISSNFLIYNDQLDISSIEKEKFSVLFGDI